MLGSTPGRCTLAVEEAPRKTKRQTGTRFTNPPQTQTATVYFMSPISQEYAQSSFTSSVPRFHISFVDHVILLNPGRLLLSTCSSASHLRTSVLVCGDLSLRIHIGRIQRSTNEYHRVIFQT